MDVTVAIIGAGSARFSATVVRDLCVTAGLRGSRVVLMDTDAGRLEWIGLLANRLSEETEAGLSVGTTTDRAEALTDADFVINTALDGGHGRAEAERALSEKHGYYRGVGLHGIRQEAFFLEVARDMERLCPDAWLIQSANPVFEGCTLLARETSIKTIGLCHGHYGYRRVARVLGLDLEHVTAHAHGFNHCIWMTDFRYKGADAYPRLDEWIENEAETYWREHHVRHYTDVQMSRAAIHQYKLFGLLGIGDTPRSAGWWYLADLETRQQWYNADGGFDSEVGWAKYLDDCDRRVEQVRQVAQDEARPVTETFPPRRSDEQIVPIIDSIVHDTPRHFQVNIPNRGPTLKGFPEDVVVEVPGVVNGSGIRGISVPDLPTKLVLGMLVPRWQKAELRVEAVRTADSDCLLHLLLSDPRTQSLGQAEALLDAWLADPENGAVRRLFHTE